MRNFPLAIRIAEVRRELALREVVYSQQVSRGKMKEADKLKRIAIMQDVHDTLMWLQEHEAEIAAMIAAKEKAA